MTYLRARRAASSPDEITLHPGWRRTLLVSMPFAGLAFALGIAFEILEPPASAFDLTAYVLGVLLVAWFEVALYRSPKRTGMLVSVLASGLGLFFLSKLIYLLFFAPAGTRTLGELTESFFWAPVLYALVSFVPRAGWGRVSTTIFAILTPLVTALYLVRDNPLASEPRVVHALLQLNLACLVMIFLSRAFAQFYLHFSQIHSRSAMLEQLAHTDALTGLPNRLGLERTLAAATQGAQPFAVMFIDLDRFKRVNDVQGHSSGDELLRVVSARLASVVRTDDSLTRLSGDEFILLARNVAQDDQARQVAQKLHDAFAEPFELTRQSMKITASIGYCLYPQDGQDAETLLRHADSAMYRAKAAGRDGLRRFIPTDRSTEDLHSLEEALQGATERNELTLVYQPLFSLHSGALVKTEALLRWHHPGRGHIPPGTFIPLAEESGLILKLGRWVLESACRTLADWKQAGYTPVVVTINISPLQVTDPDFYQTVEAALTRNGLTGRDIELEITERTLLQGAGDVIAQLTRLQALGVSIAVDDFGTGYSSLGYLKDLPLDTIKIDRSFVAELSKPRQGPHYAVALIQAITTIAETLDLEVVAEGVETAEEVDILRRLGCEVAQGYFFSHPLEASHMRALLGRGEIGSPLQGQGLGGKT